jgi:hypothetical protein
LRRVRRARRIANVVITLLKVEMIVGDIQKGIKRGSRKELGAVALLNTSGADGGRATGGWECKVGKAGKTGMEGADGRLCKVSTVGTCRVVL